MSERPSVIVTGAAGGIGAATATLLAARDYRVIAADVHEVADVHDAGDVVRVRLDVGDPASWAEVAETVGRSHERLVGLVSNAGIAGPGGVMATSDEAWQQVHRVNLDGVFFGMRAIGPLLRDGGGGSIVNVSSAAGLMGYHDVAYASSKWAVRGLSKSAAAEFARWGVRVNSVHPGLVSTPMAGEPGPYVAAHLEAVPLGEMATAHQVAETIAFLVGDQSEHITAAEFAVDGGLAGAGTYFAIRNRARTLRDQRENPDV